MMKPLLPGSSAQKFYKVKKKLKCKYLINNCRKDYLTAADGVKDLGGNIKPSWKYDDSTYNNCFLSITIKPVANHVLAWGLAAPAVTLPAFYTNQPNSTTVPTGTDPGELETTTNPSGGSGTHTTPPQNVLAPSISQNLYIPQVTYDAQGNAVTVWTRSTRSQMDSTNIDPVLADNHHPDGISGGTLNSGAMAGNNFTRYVTGQYIQYSTQDLARGGIRNAGAAVTGWVTTHYRYQAVDRVPEDDTNAFLDPMEREGSMSGSPRTIGDLRTSMS